MAKENIIEVIKEATNGLLNEEALTAIQEAVETTVNKKVSLSVEKALNEQDVEYSAKLKNLLEAVEADRSQKLAHVVKTLDRNSAIKLKKVINKYQSALVTEAKQFKNKVVNSLSKYLTVYLDEKVPASAIKEAVQNRKARMVLSNLREQLAVDSSIMKNSVRTAVLDGKRQINEAHIGLEKVQRQNKALAIQLARAQAALVLEQKTASLPEGKRAYAKKIMSGKSPKFIVENIDYALNLFDKNEEDVNGLLKEEALKQTKTLQDDSKKSSQNKEDVIEESAENTGIPNVYLTELQKY